MNRKGIVSKKYKGQYIKFSNSKATSKSYKKSKKKSSKRKSLYRTSLSLYDNGNKKPQIKSGYGNKQLAEQTIKNLKGKSKKYKIQILNTLYNRAKYHKYQTSGMIDAMKVFNSYKKSLK